MSEKWFDQVFSKLGIIHKARCLFVNNVCKLAFTAFEGPLKASYSNKHCLSMIHNNDSFLNFKFTVELVEVLVFYELGVRIEPRIVLRIIMP